MNYGPYVFKKEDAFRFADFIGIAHYQRGEELFLKNCPFCRGTGDNEKSFSINLKTGMFHCFRASCGVSGNLVTLARDFDFSLGNDVDDYYRPKPEKYRRLRTPPKPIVPKQEAVSFLESRKISKQTAEKYEVTVQSNAPNILVFPFFDDRGLLQCVKYRKTNYVKGVDKCKEWFERDTKPILFGMKQASDLTKPIVLCEGQLDSLSVAEAGVPNALSVPNGCKGFSWIPHCWNYIHKFPELIIFGDYEKGHITLLEELKNRVRIPVKHVREEDYKDCKDANEILQKYGKGAVRACVERAIPVPVARVIEASDVKRLDIYSIQKLKTGFKLLDRFLYGGLPFGGVTILTAREGNGKSTVASQLLVRAIDQGFKCFAYSGELINEIFVSWMGFQVAGPNHVTVRTNQFNDEEYLLSDRNFELISEWYRGKLWLYDVNDKSIDKGDETGSLTKLIEEMIMRFGVQVILVDNLMTALSMEDLTGDENTKQTEFMKKLVELGIRYKVLIILVAHRRKNANSEYDVNAEVAGTSNLANLAQIVLSYGKGKDLPEDKRLLKLSKNRLFGKTNLEGWEMSYDAKSRRIYTDHNGTIDDVNFEIEWQRKENDFAEDTDEDNPFH